MIQKEQHKIIEDFCGRCEEYASRSRASVPALDTVLLAVWMLYHASTMNGFRKLTCCSYSAAVRVALTLHAMAM